FNFNAENCIETISDYWFSTNTRISKMTIGENVITIPNKAFKNCTDIDSIVSAAMIPPVIYASTFDSNLSYNIPVVVPCGTVSAYEDADFWYNFRHIQQSADCGASYTITVVSANPNRGTVDGGGTYPVGTVVTISATANEGYEFSSWNDDNTDNPRTITVTSDATYIASFIPAVGIDESIATEIAIFPNPANDILNITSSETISEIEIVNVMGQVVKRIEVNSDNVVCNVEDLKAGVYVVRIRTALATLSQRRFVKE
ncbi:MAG: T9SS type A sorting domain-containing protein, partial [Bacteroidales bacterium]|nr:T9SS type A sorting domain-containing protein [Bacteroidales bacterium]